MYTAANLMMSSRMVFGFGDVIKVCDMAVDHVIIAMRNVGSCIIMMM